MAKAAMDPRLRCTEVDENGNVVMVDGELKKSELIAKVRGLKQMQRCYDCITNESKHNSTVFCLAIFARSIRPTFLISSSVLRRFFSTCCT